MIPHHADKSRHCTPGERGFRSWQGTCPVLSRGSVGVLPHLCSFLLSAACVAADICLYSCFNKFLSCWHLFDLTENSFPPRVKSPSLSGLRFNLVHRERPARPHGQPHRVLALLQSPRPAGRPPKQELPRPPLIRDSPFYPWLSARSKLLSGHWGSPGQTFTHLSPLCARFLPCTHAPIWPPLLSPHGRGMFVLHVPPVCTHPNRTTLPRALAVLMSDTQEQNPGCCIHSLRIMAWLCTAGQGHPGRMLAVE